MPQLRNLVRGLELIARGSGSLIEQQKRFGVSNGTDDSMLRVEKLVIVSSFVSIMSLSETVFNWLCPTCYRY